jgi:uncharacterized membrane protein
MILILSIFGGTDGHSAEDYAFGSGIAALYVFIVMGSLLLGCSGFFLALVRGEAQGPGAILGGFNNFFRALGILFLYWIFIYLWSILLVIPGIIAYYAYTQAFFVLADDPQIGPFRALRQSRRVMRGNKFKFFCLYISFIGWSFVLYAVCVALLFPLAVVPNALPGMLSPVLFALVFTVLPAPLVVYMLTANAIFYDILTGRRQFPATDAEVWRLGTDAREEGDGAALRAADEAPEARETSSDNSDSKEL